MPTSRYTISEVSQEAPNSKLLYVSYSKYGTDWRSELHRHPFTELFYVTKGKGFFQVENSRFPLKKDDFVIVNPDTEHTERSDGEEPLEYIILGIKNLSFSFESKEDHILFSCKNDKQDLMFYMNTMLKEMENQDPNSDLICRNLLEVLIIKLIRRTNFAFDINPQIRLGKECLKLKRYIEANYSNAISLDELAGVSHLNKYYMVHIFTKKFGCSPINYLNQVRIQASREMLESSDWSIAEIAEMTGFSSQSYFAQCFQKMNGMSARSYRNQFKTALT